MTSENSEIPPTGDSSSDLAKQLWDIEQIKQLKARYFRLMDTKDWDRWKDLFTEDCVHHLPAELNAPPQTNAEYLELVPRLLANAFTTHHGHMPEITLVSLDRGHGGVGDVRLRALPGPADRDQGLRPLPRDLPQVRRRQVAHQLETQPAAAGRRDTEPALGSDPRQLEDWRQGTVKIGFAGLGNMGGRSHRAWSTWAT